MVEARFANSIWRSVGVSTLALGSFRFGRRSCSCSRYDQPAGDLCKGHAPIFQESARMSPQGRHGAVLVTYEEGSSVGTIGKGTCCR